MPHRTVRLHPGAIADARASRKWYENRSVSAANAFMNELDRAIEQISEFADQWPIYILGTKRFLLHRFPFSVVYRALGNVVEIVAIAHARRKPGYWTFRT